MLQKEPMEGNSEEEKKKAQAEKNVNDMRAVCKEYRMKIDAGFPLLLNKETLQNMYQYLNDNMPKDWSQSPQSQFWSTVDRFRQSIHNMFVKAN